MSISSRVEPNTLVDKKFIGIPYVHQGKSFEGADCIGLAVLFLREQGVEVDYDDGNGRVMRNWWQKNPRRFMDAMLSMGSVVSLPQARRLDCLMFIFGNEGNTFPSCLGIMVDDRHFLISTEERGSHVQMMSSFWKEKYSGAVRLHKVVERGL